MLVNFHLNVWPLNYIKDKFKYYVYHNDVASGSEMTPCSKIDKPLVV